MFKHLFDGIQHINFYAIFSLLIFFFFFIVMAIWMMKADKKHLQEMSIKPLEESNSNPLQ